MKNKIFLLTMLTTLLFLISCGKKRTFKIKAINPVTGQGYAGLNYIITATKSISGGEKKVFEETGVLNENGEALIQLKVKPNRTYNIGCKEPPNTCYTKDIKFTYAIQDEPNPTFQFEYAECATWQRKVKNVNCIDTNDKIEITIQNSLNSLLPNPWILYGCADYETVVTKVPIGTYNLQWVVTKNGISTSFSDSFILNENDFKYHTINY